MTDPEIDPEVLLVDNDELAVHAMRLRFEQAGYRCTVAHSGAQALAAYHPEYTALVVTDLRMPNGSGADLIHSLLEISDTPIIVVTGSSDANELGRLCAQNITVLQKPFDLSELLHTAKRKLQGRGRRAA